MLTVCGIVSLLACASRNAVHVFSYDHLWTGYGVKYVDREKSIVRITTARDQARFESDFELNLIDQQRGESISVEREGRRYERNPLPPLPTCAPIEFLMVRNQCSLGATKDGAQKIRCEKNANQAWTLVGAKRSPSLVSLKALLQANLLTPDTFCILRDYPLDFAELQIRDFSDPKDRKEWSLIKREVTEAPYRAELFQPPAGYRSK
jgi:hypothetical protein